MARPRGLTHYPVLLPDPTGLAPPVPHGVSVIRDWLAANNLRARRAFNLQGGAELWMQVELALLFDHNVHPAALPAPTGQFWTIQRERRDILLKKASKTSSSRNLDLYLASPDPRTNRHIGIELKYHRFGQNADDFVKGLKEDMDRISDGSQPGNMDLYAVGITHDPVDANVDKSYQTENNTAKNHRLAEGVANQVYYVQEPDGNGGNFNIIWPCLYEL